MPFNTFPIPSADLSTVAADARTAIDAMQNTNAAVNAAIATDQQATLRAANVIGYNRQVDTSPGDLWRPYVKMLRRNDNLAPNRRSLRTLTLGDSVAVSLNGIVSKAYGYGGQYIQAAVGVGFTSIEDWTNSPTGWLRRMSASGHYVSFDPQGVIQAVGLVYKAQNGGGVVKIQYQEAKTGSWIDCTNAWAIGQKSDNVQITSGHATINVRDHHQLVAGMTVTGSGIPGGTTVSSVGAPTVSKTASTTAGSATVTLNNVTGLAIGMRVTGGVALNAYISAINPGSNQVTLSGVVGTTTTSQPMDFQGVAVTLSANCTSTTTSSLTFRHVDSGSDSGSGLLSTNNNGSDTYAVAWIILPNGTSGTGPNYYNIRATYVSGGNVDVIGAYFDNGAFGFGQTNGIALHGHICGEMAAAGTQLAQHHSVTSQAVWNRALAMLDPEIITYKTANALTLSNLQTYWPGYAAKLRAAAPNALLIVVGSHPSNLYPDRDAADMVACDNYWRKWCSENDGAIFVDLRANFPAQNYNHWTTDGLWVDGIHPYNGGMDWAALMVWSTIRPVVEAMLLTPYTAGKNSIRPIIGDGNEIRLYEQAAGSSQEALKNTFSVATSHDSDGFMFLRNSRNGTISGAVSNGCGFSIRSESTGNHAAGELVLYSRGTRVQQWSNQRGSLTGYGLPNDASRANNGHRFFTPNPIYGTPGFVVEGRNGINNNTTSSTLNAVFGIDINATDTTYGAKLWEWLPDGSVKNNGVIWKGAAVCTLNSTTTISCTDTSGLTTGMAVWGDGIPAGATISSIVSNTSITLSAAATLTGSRPLAFTRTGTTTYTYEDYGTNATIHHVRGNVAGTGAKPNYQFAAPGYENAAGAAADTNLPSGALYYDESTGVGRIKP